LINVWIFIGKILAHQTDILLLNESIPSIMRPFSLFLAMCD
jgi:hypothetical protein